MSFSSLDGFIPSCCFFFFCIIRGVVSLISLSDSLLLVCRNATDVCILLLHPIILPSSLKSSSSILVVSSEFSVSCHVISKHDDSASFPVWSLLFLFLFLSDYCG